jgi:hypothetical protein
MEKRPLNELHGKARFKGDFKRCQQPQHKAFILLQAALGGLEIADFSMKMETDAMVESASRVVRACQEYSVEAGAGAAAYYSLLLGAEGGAPCLVHEAWVVSDSVGLHVQAAPSGTACGSVSGRHCCSSWRASGSTSPSASARPASRCVPLR